MIVREEGGGTLLRKESIVESGFIMLLGTCLNILISIITTPIITRLVTPTDYGQWSLFVTYTNTAQAVILMGLDQAFVRFYYKDNRLVYKKYLTYTVIKIPVIVFFFVFGISFGFIRKIQLFEFKGLFPYILLYLSVFSSILNRFSQLVLRMEQKSKIYSLSMVLNKAIYVTLALVLVLYTEESGFVILALTTIIAQIIVTIIAIGCSKDIWKFNLNEFRKVVLSKKELILYGLPFIYSALAGDVFNFIDKWSLKSMETYAEVGIYSSAANIVAICAIVQTTFNLLWAPLAMKHYEDDPSNKSFYIKANGCITIAMFFVGAAVICFKDIIVFLLGNDYREAATVIPFLLFNPIMMTVSETTVYGINFKNKTWLHGVITTICALVNIVLNTCFIPSYSAEGAALATAISYIVFYILRTLLSNKCYPVRYPNIKYSIVSILFFGYSFLNTFYSIKWIPNFMLFIIFIGILIGLYKKFVKILFETIFNELKDKIKK